jgi:hypothetical protein
MRQNSFDDSSLGIAPHPPYSPDLAPPDFWLFGHIKTSLVDCVFNEIDEFLEAVTLFLNEIQPSELQFIFHH